MTDVYTPAFDGTSVGLIVRGKTSHSHHPDNLQQHADCVLSDGSPIGFFGERGGSMAGSGLGMEGEVYDYDEFQIKRPFYVDGTQARTMGVISGLLRVVVSSKKARDFDNYWKTLDAAPGSFNIVGGNCSTGASNAFRAAGILAGGIPGLDTPDNLWAQLCRTHRSRVFCCFGYINFSQTSAGNWRVRVEGV